MKKILLSSALFMLFAYFNAALAENLFRIVLPSAIGSSVEKQIRQALNSAVAGRDFEIVLHKAETPKADSATFAQVLKLPSAGVIAVIDKPDWGDSWAENILRRYSGTAPILSIGLVDLMTGFDAQIGAKIQDYADLAIQFLRQNKGDTLCLFARNSQWCDMLASHTDGAVIRRAVAMDQAMSMQMAATVSAMTQNPNITHIFLTDVALYPSVKQALQIVGGTFTIGGLGSSGSEAQLDFSTDAQWILQTVLAVTALEIQAKYGQNLAATVPVVPRIPR